MSVILMRLRRSFSQIDASAAMAGDPGSLLSVVHNSMLFSFHSGPLPSLMTTRVTHNCYAVLLCTERPKLHNYKDCKGISIQHESDLLPG
jgi:hypothetical protein